MSDLLVRGVPTDTRRAFSAGAVRIGMTQADFLAWLLTEYASHLIAPPKKENDR